jgi:S-adenosyl-L-methionine hydrolase (adenosine-forming)
MSAPLPPVTLTTDFGITDHYVAQMKGVILGLAPGAPIVDVTHEIPPQDVRRAAHLIADLADAFPAGTVHIAVVDPGVGSDRAILAVASGGQFYIAPDNGLLTHVFLRAELPSVVVISNPLIRRKSVSNTFHGRDVMAPAAAHLVTGGALSDLGPKPEKSPVRVPCSSGTIFPDRIESQVAWVDRFGNLVVSVPADMLTKFPPERLRVSIGPRQLLGLKRFYAEVPTGDPLLLVGSSGQLEIAVNGGSAAERFGASAGARVVIDAASPL